MGTVFTITSQVVDTPLPSSAEQVMVVEPALMAVTRPVLLTVATLSSELDHVTDLLVAFDG